MNNNKVFTPYIVILLCNMFCYYIFSSINRQMLVESPISNEAYSLLKLWLAPGSSIILASVYFIARSRISTYEVVKRTYYLLIAFVFLFTFILIPNYIQSPPSVDYTSPLQELLNKGVLTTFYLFLSLWTPITVLNFYGYANERLSFKEAAQIYPILAIVGILFSQMIIPFLLSTQASKFVESLTFGPGTLAIILLSLSLRSIVKINKSKPISQEVSNFHVGVAFVLMLCLITVTIGFTKYISVTCWDCSFKLDQPSTSAYWHNMKPYTMLKTLSNFMAILVLAFLSIYLQQYRIKGWKHFCYVGTAITSFITLSLLFLSFFASPHTQILSTAHASLISATIIKIGNNYQVFLSTIMYPTFLCLLHLIFISIPLKHRFKAKIIVDLIFKKAGFLLAVGVQQWIEPNTASFLQFSLYFSVVFIMGTALKFYSIHYISKRAELSDIY